MSIKRNGNNMMIEFCKTLIEINFDEDSKKITNKKPREKIFNLFTLKVGSLFDFNINRREIAMRNEMYSGFINLEYISS